VHNYFVHLHIIMSNKSKNKTRFLQKSFWSHPDDNPKEYMILIEIDNESELPIGTLIVSVPPRFLLALKYHVILN